MNCLKIVTILAAVSATALAAQAQSAAMADLRQDIDLLRREVGTLKLEIEQLRRDNSLLAQKLARFESSSVANESVSAQMEVARSQTNARMEKLKREIIDIVKKDLETMANQTNVQISKLANAIGRVPQSNVQKTFSEDYPQTGVVYVVQPGDSISKLARQKNSKIEWIQNANRIADPSTGLRVGAEIFIPQK